MPFGQFWIHVRLSVLLPNDQLFWHSVAIRPHEHDPDDTHPEGIYTIYIISVIYVMRIYHLCYARILARRTGIRGEHGVHECKSGRHRCAGRQGARDVRQSRCGGHFPLCIQLYWSVDW